MSDTQVEIRPSDDMTQEELEQYMQEPVTRAEMLSTFQNLLNAELTPMMESKFAFLISLMRFMFGASGAMNADDFADAYQKYMDAFTEKYTDVGTEAEDGKPPEA